MIQTLEAVSLFKKLSKLPKMPKINGKKEKYLIST